MYLLEPPEPLSRELARTYLNLIELKTLGGKVTKQTFAAVAATSHANGSNAQEADFARTLTAWTVQLEQIGVEGVILALHQRLAHGETKMFPEELSENHFNQIRAERLVTMFS